MSKLLKKITLIFLSSLLFLNSLALPAAALAREEGNNTWYNSGPIDWYLKVHDEETSPQSEIFGERYTAAQVQWVMWSVLTTPINFLMGVNKDYTMCVLKFWGQQTIDLSSCALGLVEYFSDVFKIILPNIPKIQVKNQETTTLALIFDISNRPMSGIKYIKDKLNKFSLVSEVKAQGYGYGALTIIRDMWSGVRNISYGLVVMVTIILAFMIMFRVKIAPQIVISVQSAIPKIISAVILATFSYAIAGLMVDLMYVVMGLFASLLYVGDFSTDIQSAYSFVSGETFSSAIGNLGILAYMLMYWILFIFATISSLIAGVFSQFTVFGIVASVLMFIVAALFVLVVLWYTVRVPWALIKNLISVYFSIVIAPLQIMVGVFAPAIGFGQWLKKLAAELLVFPVTGVFLFLALYLMVHSYQFGQETVSDFVLSLFRMKELNVDQFWAPPWVGSVGSQSASSIIFMVMSLVIIIAVPKVAEILKMLIMGEKFAFGSAIGEITTIAKGGLTAYVSEKEELREQTARTTPGATYEPRWITKTLRTVGLVGR